MISMPSWLAISICTNTGAGILFWSIAEPIYHVSQPPKSLGIIAGSAESAQFAMSTLFMHWSLTPSALFCLPGLVFALAFYNLRQPFSLSSCLQPLVGSKWSKRLSAPTDSIALYALALGMSASLGTGILTISGGLEYMYGIASNPTTWTIVGIVIVAAFIVSAATGIEKGITYLSHINSVFFFLLAGFVLIFGSIGVIAAYSWDGIQQMTTDFFNKSLFFRFAADDPWPKQWTIFYWAVWLAWTPVTAGFLGRIARGYSVRQFFMINLWIPAVFAILWTGIFGATTLSLELGNHIGLTKLLADKGPESLAYAVFAQFPMARLIIPIFLILVFISYVTAADSNTVTMAGMSTKGLSQENAEPPVGFKILWGVIVGTLALVMLGHSGIEGIKSLSYLGGLPALVFEIGALLSLIVLTVKSEAFGLTKSSAAVKVEEQLAAPALILDGTISASEV